MTVVVQTIAIAFSFNNQLRIGCSSPVYAEEYAMLWDYLKTLITLRLTLQAPCMCAGCKRGQAKARK